MSWQRAAHVGVRPEPGVLPARPLSPRVVLLLVWLCVGAVVVRPVVDVLAGGRPAGVGADVSIPQTVLGDVLGLGLAGTALALAGLALAPRLPGLHPPAPVVAAILLLGFEWLVSWLQPEASPASPSLAVLCLAGLLTAALAPLCVPAPRPEALVAYPLGVVAALSLLWLVLQPQNATFEVARFALNPLEQRLAGVSEHPNILGLLMGLAVTVAATHRFRWRWPILAACAACLVMSESRTAMAAAVLSIVVIAAMKASAPRHSGLVAGGVLVTSLLACLLPLWLPASREIDVALSERPLIWQMVLTYWSDHWLAGHGPTTLSRLVLADSRFPAFGGHAHNLVLQELFVGGVIGLGLLVALLVLLTRRAAAQSRAGHTQALAALVFVLVSAPTEDPISVLQHGSSILILVFVVSLCSLPRPPLPPKHRRDADGV